MATRTYDDLSEDEKSERAVLSTRLSMVKILTPKWTEAVQALVEWDRAHGLPVPQHLPSNVD